MRQAAQKDLCGPIPFLSRSEVRSAGGSLCLLLLPAAGAVRARRRRWRYSRQTCCAACRWAREEARSRAETALRAPPAPTPAWPAARALTWSPQRGSSGSPAGAGTGGAEAGVVAARASPSACSPPCIAQTTGEGVRGRRAVRQAPETNTVHESGTGKQAVQECKL